jgi:NAD-dependent DNA ligase
VGRTGVLTPFAVLDPVDVGGATVTYASLHNADQIAKKDLRDGDWVQVVRAGDVIPYVLGPVPERRDGTERTWSIPTHCPRCHSATQRYGDDVATYCPNVACPGRQLEGLVHCSSKEALDIDGLGARQIELFFERGVLRAPQDIFRLRKNIEAAGLPPFGRLAALVVSAADRNDAERHARDLARSAEAPAEVMVLGPAEAPIALLRGRHRFRLLVKTDRAFDLQAYLRDWLKRAPKARGSVRVQVDVDPQSFF